MHARLGAHRNAIKIPPRGISINLVSSSPKVPPTPLQQSSTNHPACVTAPTVAALMIGSLDSSHGTDQISDPELQLGKHIFRLSDSSPPATHMIWYWEWQSWNMIYHISLLASRIPTLATLFFYNSSWLFAFPLDYLQPLMIIHNPSWLLTISQNSSCS